MAKRKKRLTDEIRKTVIENYERGMKIMFISGFLNHPYSTIKNVVDLYKRTGRIASLKSGGARNNKITPEIKARIVDIVNGKADIMLKRISLLINNEFSIMLDPSTIHNCLEKFHYTFKNLGKIPIIRNSPERIEERYLYALEFFGILGEVPDSKIFFVDEAGYNIAMRSRKGRSLRGEPAYLEVPCIRSRNVSVCCAMNKYGVTFKKISTRAYNTLSFLGYIQDFFAFFNESDLKNCVVIVITLHFTNQTALEVHLKQRVIAYFFCLRTHHSLIRLRIYLVSGSNM
jgi:transposase